MGTDEPTADDEEEEEDGLLVLPGLDGSLFVIGDGGEAHPLTDFTVQVRPAPLCPRSALHAPPRSQDGDRP